MLLSDFCCRIHRRQKKGPGVSDGAFGDSCDVLSTRAQAKNPWMGFFRNNAFCGDKVHGRESYANQLWL
jgi:hypothetical protein